MCSIRAVRVALSALFAEIGSLACLGLAISGCGRTASLPPEDPSRLSIQLSSAAFADGGTIPKEYTCDGSDGSPPLAWSGVPQSARTLTLICDDPDAPGGTWSHWVLFDLPAHVKALKEAVPPSETVPDASIERSQASSADSPQPRQGKNDFGKIGYGGPCPPSGTHRYIFRLYALDTRLGFGSTASRADVLGAIKGHILAEGRLSAKYQRGAKD